MTVSKGVGESGWLGWQFLNGLQKQGWQAGLLAHPCVLRNTLAGSKIVVSMSGTGTVNAEDERMDTMINELVRR